MDVTVTWQGEERFVAYTAGGAQVAIDGSKASGASPVETLQIALAACMGIDVVDILTKGRQEPSACTVAVTGERREKPPRRLTRVRLGFRIEGRGLSRAKVERAVELSRSTYCSVWHSMAPDIDLAIEIELPDEG